MNIKGYLSIVFALAATFWALPTAADASLQSSDTGSISVSSSESSSLGQVTSSAGGMVNSGTGRVWVNQQAPTVVMSGTGTGDAMRDDWLTEANGLKNAEVIGESSAATSLSRIGSDVVVKGTINGPVDLLSGRLFVLGIVNGPVSVVGGDTTILGTVSGPVSIVGGNLRIAGRVNGNVSVVGGNIVRARGSAITGSTSTVGGGFSLMHNVGFGRRGMGFNRAKSRKASFLFKGLMFVWWLVATALAALVMPRTLDNFARQLGADPLRTGAIGLLFWIVFWFVVLISILLCFLLVGIPMVGLLAIGFLLTKWFGLSVVSLWLGRIVCERFRWPTASLMLPVAVGIALLSLIRMIPVLGFIVWIVAGLLAGGVAVTACRRTRLVLPGAQGYPA